MRFEELNLIEMDKNLTEEQRKEWNAIYASYRSASVLTGKVMGIDINKIPVRNEKTGVVETKEIRSLVIVSYRVKVLIPEQEIWYDGNSRPSHVLNSMYCSVFCINVFEFCSQYLL